MNHFRHTWVLLLPLLVSCEKVLFTPEPESDPASIFQAVWQDYKDHYGPTTYRDVNWDSLHSLYSPMVTSTSTDQELYLALTEMLSTLDDGHVQITTPGREHWYANTWYRERTGDNLFDLDVVHDHYLSTDGLFEVDNAVLRGHIGDVGYIHFSYVAGNLTELDALLDNGFQGKLIIDLRHNEGGDFTFALNAFDRLTATQIPVFSSRTKNGPGPDEFTPWYHWQLEPDPRLNHVDAQVVVLVDRFTISAGERATLMLAALPGVQLLGDTTNGALSTMVGREMANGWGYTIATQEILLPDGITWEGIGIPPDRVVINDPAALAAGHDAVLDSALALLR